MRARTIVGVTAILGGLLVSGREAAAAVQCPDGTFHPLSSIICDMSFNPTGVFNFTTVTIPTGVTVRFTRNASNTPVVINATGDVVIEGAIELSASSQTGGPGGGNGGDPGIGAGDDGTVGIGPSPGGAGAGGAPNPGHAGGGGGMATAGGTAFRHTAFPPADGGAAIPFPDPLTGGSGGGGGGGWTFATNALSGGYGGGAGGGMRISTIGNITISGSIRSNGADGHWSFANAFGFGGPGGGGSAGVIDLAASAITLTSTAHVQALGGAGGATSINNPNFTSGAGGGLGYARFVAGTLALQGHIEAFVSVGTATVFPINPFLCYTARTTFGSPRFVPPADVTLADEFQSKLFDVRRPMSLCAPASKNGEGLVDPDVHLEAYQITQTATLPRQPLFVRQTNIGVVTQFGSLTLDTVRPDRLLVPTAKCIDDPAGSCPDPLPAPTPGTHHVEHFACYTTRTTTGTPRFTTLHGVSVDTQFIAGAGKLFDLRSPSRLCAPADKNGEGVTNTGPHLLCYPVLLERGQQRQQTVEDVRVSNQLDRERLNVVREEELCVPAVVLP